MYKERFITPVVFMVFNRPETTKKVFAKIREIRPAKLLVIADGPRVYKDGEAGLCAAVRKIIEDIDWPCEVLKNYADINMGCRKRISSGLDWAFSLVDEAIILEDDCLPDLSFFSYCTELLERYRDNERVMMIAGSNFLYEAGRPADSYYFSKYPNIWGWATWKRAWNFYDVDMCKWPELKKKRFLKGFLKDWYMEHYFTVTFDNVHRGKVDTWDAQWTLACMSNNGYSAVPEINLISNIGYGNDSGTHPGSVDKCAFMSTGKIEFPLKHPPKTDNDSILDIIECRQHFGKSIFACLRALLGKLKRILEYNE